MTGARGRGWFTGGAIGMVVTGLMHLSAHLRPPPPGSEAAHDAMVAFTVTAGLTWSLWDAYQVLSFSFATLSIGVGALDLYVARALRPTGPALAGLAGVNALIAAALVAITAAGHVAPPLVLYGILAVVFALAALRARGSHARA